MRFESEEDLYAPVKAFFEGQGYDVKAEVRGCDLIARRGDEAPIIVELKIGFTLPLVLQGIDRLALSDQVYLAVAVAERPARNSLWRRERRGILKLCRRLGLGLLAVHEGNARTSPLVEPLLDPLPYQPRPNRKRQTLLLKEFAHRIGDPNTRRPDPPAHCHPPTARTPLRCATLLQRQGPTKAAEVARLSAVEKAAAILQRDVYGWFQRVERGVYRLSPKGEEALRTFADVVASLDGNTSP